MKRILLILMVFASVANAQAVDEWTFFSGAHLGMTIEECYDFYFPVSGVRMADTTMTYGAAPEGQKYLEFRSYGSSVPYHDWRVMTCYRASDRVIVSISYSNDDHKFSQELIRHLKNINKDWPDLIANVSDDYHGTDLVVTTVVQSKLESDIAARATKH